MAAMTAAGWRAFWDRGGWWKAVAFAVVYVGLYLGAGRLVGAVFGDRIDADDLFGDTQTVLLALALPSFIGAVIVLLAAASFGWLRELFSAQPVAGTEWMWLAPVVVTGAVVLRAFGTDYGEYATGVIVATYLAGLFIGLAEELLVRGIAITLLRRAGYGELAVMLLSSLLFALIHSVNVLSGQSWSTVLATMGFAFVFGVAMYLTLRVTGFLIWPILLHALTDPSTFLATGGIDEQTPGGSGLSTLAGMSVFVYAALVILALILVRGRVRPEGADEPRNTSPAT